MSGEPYPTREAAEAHRKEGFSTIWRGPDSGYTPGWYNMSEVRGIRPRPIRVGGLVTIEELQKRPSLILVTEDYNVRDLRGYLNRSQKRRAKEYDGFLVEVLDGDYGEIYGFSGVPYLYKQAERIK